MPLVKVKEKFQVTIPTELREALHLTVGDLLEATIQGQTIVLKPKCSDLITSADLLDYIADLDLNYVRIAIPSC